MITGVEAAVGAAVVVGVVAAVLVAAVLAAEADSPAVAVDLVAAARRLLGDL